MRVGLLVGLAALSASPVLEAKHDDEPAFGKTLADKLNATASAKDGALRGELEGPRADIPLHRSEDRRGARRRCRRMPVTRRTGPTRDAADSS
jgi:hypothetical protein